LFDQGLRTDLDFLLRVADPSTSGCCALPDLALTLLKRGEENLLKRVVEDRPLVFFLAPEFCFWPLINWLETTQLLKADEFGKTKNGSLHGYWQARKRGIDPPPWWRWR
jgi:hypothetical protein